MANEIKLGMNKVEFLGVVKEQKLKALDNEKGKSITGSLILKCGEFKEIEIKVFASQYSKKEMEKPANERQEAKKYATLKDFLDGILPTMASAKEDEQPTIVSIWGNEGFTASIKENRYKNKQTQKVVTNPQFDLGFANITVKQDVEEKDFKADFDIEVYVDKVTEEIDTSTNENTGRTLINGYLPLYGGSVMPIELVGGIINDDEGELNMGELLLDNVREGDTLSVYGDINFEKIITETKSQGRGFGRAKMERKKEYIHDFNILYAEVIEDEEKMFNEDDIRQALVQRDNELEEIKNKEDENANEEKPKRGMGGVNNEGSNETPRGQRRGF